MNRNKCQKRNAKIAANFRSRPNPGVEMLTRDADLEVQKKSADIAGGLADAAVKGNASSARLLIQLAENADWINDPEVVEQVLRVVDKWKSEPKLEEQPGEVPAGLLQESGFDSSGDPGRTVYVN